MHVAVRPIGARTNAGSDLREALHDLAIDAVAFPSKRAVIINVTVGMRNRKQITQDEELHLSVYLWNSGPVRVSKG